MTESNEIEQATQNMYLDRPYDKILDSITAWIELVVIMRPAITMEGRNFPGVRRSDRVLRISDNLPRAKVGCCLISRFYRSACRNRPFPEKQLSQDKIGCGGNIGKRSEVFPVAYL
jgi:hypothetical protein